MSDGILGVGYDSTDKLISPQCLELCRAMALSLGVKGSEVDESTVRIDRRFHTVSFSVCPQDNDDPTIASLSISAYKNGDWHICVNGSPVAEDTEAFSSVRVSLNRFFRTSRINLLKWFYEI